MVRFLSRRVLLAVPVLLGVVLLVFVLARVIPGDPCRVELGERATAAQCDAFKERAGLNQPLPVQFVKYLQQLATGDLGNSVKYGRPVTALLVERMPTTLELSALALLIAISVGVPLGILSAARHNSKADVVTMIGANIGVSTPVFVLGLILAFVFTIVLKGTPFALPPSGRLSPGLIPQTIPQAWHLGTITGIPGGILQFLSNMYLVSSLVTGQWNVFVDAFRHLILPAVALATIPLAIIARITRSSLLDVLGLDYVRTARAKGQTDRGVLMRHAMRNALLPLVTIIGLSLGGLLAGAVLTETIFSLAGVGQMLYDAISGRDYAVIQGFTLVIAFGFVLVNLLVDLSYAYLDPRIRLS
jgi:peptide/nickel transport system permease protein